MATNDRILLSICISSYNKGKKCIGLVNRILNLNDDRLNVVICDDCSDEETQLLLNTLADDRVTVHINSQNLGACPNWFETMNHGDGRYILHVLDRDYIDFDIVLRLLDFLEKNEIGVGYLGGFLMKEPEWNMGREFSVLKGCEATAALIGGIPMHPTGFLVNRESWKPERFKKYFYDNKSYGIYPHAYLMGIIGTDEKVLLNSRNFCRYVYSQFSKSQFYCNSNVHEYWWEPKSILKTYSKMALEICRVFSDERYKREFLINSFNDSIARATIGYRGERLNKRQMQHYALEVESISVERILFISIWFTVRYLSVINRVGILDYEMKKKILNISLRNMKDILMYY